MPCISTSASPAPGSVCGIAAQFSLPLPSKLHETSAPALSYIPTIPAHPAVEQGTARVFPWPPASVRLRQQRPDQFPLGVRQVGGITTSRESCATESGRPSTDLAAGNRTYDLLQSPRCHGGPGFAILTGRWHTLHPCSSRPWAGGLGPPYAGDRWMWLIITAHIQLRLA